MHRIRILDCKMVIPSGWIQGLGCADCVEVEPHIPSRVDIAGEDQVQHVAVASSKESIHLGVGRLGIIVPHAVGRHVVQVIGMKARGKPNHPWDFIVDRLRGTAYIAQILVHPPGLCHRLVVMEIVQKGVGFDFSVNIPLDVFFKKKEGSLRAENHFGTVVDQLSSPPGVFLGFLPLVLGLSGLGKTSWHP